jgi:origin recognition complex subunit 1
MPRPRKSGSKIDRARQWLSVGQVTREDSDDELGYDDLPWEWIYADSNDGVGAGPDSKKRKRAASSVDKHEATTGKREIIGARMGKFICRVGDTVFLKSADSQAWIGLICEFIEDEEEGEKMANFMWFSSPSEIRNKTKKRTDYLPVRSEHFFLVSLDIIVLT